MQFELNDYHKNITDEELILDIQATAKKLGKTTLTGTEYCMYGRYHDSTIRRRFGSWKKVLEVCQLETQGHNFKCNFTDEEVIADVKRVANTLGVPTISAREYNIYGKYSVSTLKRRYGTWNEVLKLVEIEAIQNRNFTDEEMFEEIERIWIMLGRQPTTTDIKSGISKYSLNSYSRRFGGWRGALQAFVNYINSDDKKSTSSEDTEVVIQQDKIITHEIENKHKTPRDINLRLRFKVMQRDNFKCCICGASPAKDSSVELHIDHIKPWSKGGETVIENLQTLCSRCNLGKSNLE